MTRPALLTLESARAELRAARRHVRSLMHPSPLTWQYGSAYDLSSPSFALVDFHQTLRRYRYARCIDLEYAIRLEKHGIKPSELRARVIGGGT